MTAEDDMDSDTRASIDEWSARLWHTCQHDEMVSALAVRLRDLANEMREAAGLERLEWSLMFPDARFGWCSVHLVGCAGQETHT